MCNEEADPNIKYELHGQFDVESYDHDLINFPDWFDENGWPLFGNYDPYTLKHPITGFAWHKAPRVPGNDEADPDYENWYYLAETFISTTYQLFDKARDRPRFPEEDPETDYAVYKTESKGAIKGNLSYFKKYVLPELDALFEQRQSTLRFAEQWAEFYRLVERLGGSILALDRRHVQRLAQDNREAQVKWYLHWRRLHCDELDKSPNKANSEFTELVNDIVCKRIVCPDGFSVDWFRKTQSQIQRETDESPRFVRGLANSLKRTSTHPSCEKLLASAPDADPEIPPTQPSDYKKCCDP